MDGNFSALLHPCAAGGQCLIYGGVSHLREGELTCQDYRWVSLGPDRALPPHPFILECVSKGESGVCVRAAREQAGGGFLSSVTGEDTETN